MMTSLLYTRVHGYHCITYALAYIFSPVGTGGMPPIHSNIMDRTVYANAISIAAESHNTEQAPKTAVPTQFMSRITCIQDSKEGLGD